MSLHDTEMYLLVLTPLSCNGATWCQSQNQQMPIHSLTSRNRTPFADFWYRKLCMCHRTQKHKILTKFFLWENSFFFVKMIFPTVCSIISFINSKKGFPLKTKRKCSKICKPPSFSSHNNGPLSSPVSFPISRQISIFGNFSRIRELVILSLICKIFKTNDQLCHVSPPVRLTLRPHGTTVLPLCTLSWNFIFNCFSTFCSEYPSSINTWQKHTALYMQTAVHLLSYLSGL